MKHSIYIGDQRLPDISHSDGAFEFIVGVILNQQISGELAWRGVARLANRVTLNPADVVTMGPGQLLSSITAPPAVHPFAAAMAAAIYEAGEMVVSQYGGDARRIWQGCSDGRELRRRLTTFRQIGEHKAQVAHYILAAGYGESPEVSGGLDVDILCPSLSRSIATYLEENVTSPEVGYASTGS